MRLSPSFVLTVEQCRLQARWLRIDKVDRGIAEADSALRLGRAIHTALEKVYDQARAEKYVGPLHTPTWVARARDHTRAAFDEHGPFTDQQKLLAGEQVLDHLLEQHEVAGGDVLGLELFTQWGLRKGTNVVSFMDKVLRREHATVEVVDYKSGNRGWDESIIRSDLQMQTYAVMALMRFKWAQRIRVTIDSTKLRRSASAQWLASELAHLEERLKERYLAADDAMATGPWEATPGPWCSRCEFAAICPAKGGTPPAGAWDPELGRVRTSADEARDDDDDAAYEQEQLLPSPTTIEPHGPRVDRRSGR